MKRSSQIAGLIAVAILAVSTSGCVVRKAVALPLRATGAVVSVVPVVGGPAHTVLDGAAEAVD